jgi:hypothetical protein
MSSLGVEVVYESGGLNDLENLRGQHIEDFPSIVQVLMKIPPK